MPPERKPADVEAMRSIDLDAMRVSMERAMTRLREAQSEPDRWDDVAGPFRERLEAAQLDNLAYQVMLARRWRRWRRRERRKDGASR